VSVTFFDSSPLRVGITSSRTTTTLVEVDFGAAPLASGKLGSTKLPVRSINSVCRANDLLSVVAVVQNSEQAEQVGAPPGTGRSGPGPLGLLRRAAFRCGHGPGTPLGSVSSSVKYPEAIDWQWKLRGLQ
jgi:hypothetical protein